MKPNVIFGPAGRPVDFKGSAFKASKYIADEGLSAYEYQGGRGLKIGEKSSLILKEESTAYDILVSIHAPYFINLSSDKSKTIGNSIEILFNVAKIAQWMGAYRIVFHPGYYLKYNSNEALQIAKSAINTLLEELSLAGIDDVVFAPETTGKKSQLGNLDEIIAICQEFDNFKLLLILLIYMLVMVEPLVLLVITMKYFLN
jgi:deoxyribonuclease-4